MYSLFRVCNPLNIDQGYAKICWARCPRRVVISQCVPSAGEKQQLYTVLEQQAAGVGAGLMGSDHTYVLPGGVATGGARRPALDARKRYVRPPLSA